jgi:hypothetical protein
MGRPHGRSGVGDYEPRRTQRKREWAERLLRLAWCTPLALTAVVTLLGLILPHVRPI